MREQTKLKRKKEFNKGITLIALVITIIVLLILVAISIATLTGENGVLTKASTAQGKTKREEIIERARVDILAQQTENFGSLTEDELTEILTTKGSLSNNGEESILDKILTTTEGQYEIKVSEIYNGKLVTKVKFFVDGVELSAYEGQTWFQFISEREQNGSEWPDGLDGLQLLLEIMDSHIEKLPGNRRFYVFYTPEHMYVGMTDSERKFDL